VIGLLQIPAGGGRRARRRVTRTWRMCAANRCGV
jgi:hypothetical protein